jgi:hypothetical protein
MQGAFSNTTPMSNGGGKIIAHPIPNNSIPPGARNLALASKHNIKYGVDRFEHLRNISQQRHNGISLSSPV